MTPESAQRSEAAALRRRLRRLNEASLHLAEGLDFGEVLQVVADSARELTGARFGAITVLDQTGDLEAFVTSGLSPDEVQGLYDLPHGIAYMEHLNQLEEPLRVRDLGDYFSSLGLQDFRLPVEAGPSLVAPVLSRGEAVGSIYLSKLSSQGLFTGEDEETLTMFATQAALAIANARRYRDERLARTDLETLIETAPVGMLVIDAEHGNTILVNRELQRINAAVRGEHDPPRELPQELVVRRADGWEDSLADNPVGELLRGGAAIRAERIVLSLPGGPAIAVLVNATPIRDADGNVASAVITVQDLTPLEELDRLRADILGLARDELRSPLVSVKGAAATLLSSHSDLHPAECAQLAQVIDEEADRIRSLIAEMGDLARIHTGTLPLTPAPTDLVGLARDTAEAVLNSADGPLVAVDADPGILLVAADRREIARVLRSIIADALWASESSVPVSIAVVPDGSFGKVTVTHRPAEPALRLAALLAGQSDAGTRLIGNGAAPSDAGRSALGLAICKGIVEAHGGRIWADGGTAGETRVSFTLPLDQPVESAVAPSDGQPARRRRTAILVIDVDPLTQRYINDTLTPAGFELAFAGDVQEALVGTDAKEPDLVLAGFAHPDAASVQLMLAMGAEADTPVVFIVDRGHDEAVVSLMQAGAADYVAKPFSPTELLARVRAALHWGAWPRAPRPGRSPSATSPSTTQPGPSPFPAVQSPSPAPSTGCYASSPPTLAALSAATSSCAACGRRPSTTPQDQCAAPSSASAKSSATTPAAPPTSSPSPAPATASPTPQRPPQPANREPGCPNLPLVSEWS